MMFLLQDKVFYATLIIVKNQVASQAFSHAHDIGEQDVLIIFNTITLSKISKLDRFDSVHCTRTL